MTSWKLFSIVLLVLLYFICFFVRVNSSSAQTTQNSQANYSFNNALIRGKQEIIQIIEKLIDNQAQDVYELISDVSCIIKTWFPFNQF